MIPVLSFVEKATDNKYLKDAFQNLGLLLSDYNYIKINDKDLYIYYTKWIFKKYKVFKLFR